MEFKSSPIEKKNVIEEWEAYSLPSDGIKTWDPSVESGQIRMGRYMTSLTLSRGMKGYRD